MVTLNDKIVIITGATSGIGEATAKLLAQEGAVVVLTGRRKDRLRKIKSEIEKSGGKALAIEADVTQKESVIKMVKQVIDEYGKIDILVNNAGVMLLGPVLNAEVTDWQRMVDTNVYGLLWCTHAVLPHMVKQGGGHIVQTSSVAGRTAGPNRAVYNATKWAVNGFTEALRQEMVEHKIRTTLIEPGAVATELREHITHKQTKQQIDDWAASMRQLQSEDIAKAIVYAVSQPDHVAINEILVRPTDQLG